MINKSPLRRTLLSLKVGKLFIVERHRQRWNQQIAKEVGTDPGSTHGILADFEHKGWLIGRMEANNGSIARSARKLYRLTDAGADAIGAMLKPLQLVSS